MKIKLTKDEAAAVSAQYQFLVGKELCVGEKVQVVDSVKPAPFDKLNKWLFFNLYIADSTDNYLYKFYPYNDFDVITILKDRATSKYVYKDLTSVIKLLKTSI